MEEDEFDFGSLDDADVFGEETVAPIAPVKTPAKAPAQVERPAQKSVPVQTKSVQTQTPVQESTEGGIDDYELEEITFDSKPIMITNNVIDMFKPEVGKTSKLRFLSDKPVVLRSHYFAKEYPGLGKRSFICLGKDGCSCCSVKRADIGYIFPVIVYPTIKDTKPLQYDKTKKPELRIWKMPKTLFEKLKEVNDEQGGILDFDFIVSTIPKGEWGDTGFNPVVGKQWDAAIRDREVLEHKWDVSKRKVYSTFAVLKTKKEVDDELSGVQVDDIPEIANGVDDDFDFMN